MSTNAKKRKSLRERRKIQRRKLQIRAAAALLSLVAVTFLLIFHRRIRRQTVSRKLQPTNTTPVSAFLPAIHCGTSPKNTVQKNTPIFPVTLPRSVRSITWVPTRSRTVCISAFRITPRSINHEIQEILYIIRLCKQSKKNSFQNARNLLKQHVREAWFTK